MIKKFTELILDLKCPKSLPGDNDWIENNVKVTDVKPTFNLIKGVACTITLKSYKDSTQTFSPNDNNSPLILSISSGGIGTLTEASKYTRVPSDGLTWYFAANTTEAYKVVLNYGKDPDNVTSEIQNKEPIEVEVIAGQGAIPPSVTGLLITKTPNNTGITDFSIFGTVANSTGCKLFKISELKTFDYKSVNSAYNGSSGTECPDFKGTQGNWTKYAAEGRIIVWLNMISGTQFNGYTYIQIDKDPK
ncbi:hypothetical protein [Silvanigrella sp.]|jgi:hypothetical protein|uniref:hypothetical protein n=1 Tax=Silvanigrella sp. TaxID=2024976 RepID=UPI0037CAE65E